MMMKKKFIYNSNYRTQYIFITNKDQRYPQGQFYKIFEEVCCCSFVFVADFYVVDGWM